MMICMRIGIVDYYILEVKNRNQEYILTQNIKILHISFRTSKIHQEWRFSRNEVIYIIFLYY